MKYCFVPENGSDFSSLYTVLVRFQVFSLKFYSSCGWRLRFSCVLLFVEHLHFFVTHAFVGVQHQDWLLEGLTVNIFFIFWTFPSFLFSIKTFSLKKIPISLMSWSILFKNNFMTYLFVNISFISMKKFYASQVQSVTYFCGYSFYYQLICQ